MANFPTAISGGKKRAIRATFCRKTTEPQTRENKMEYAPHDLLGNIGVGLILLTYFLLQIGKLASNNIWYLLANILGPVMVGISLLYDFNLSAFIIQVVWFFTSLIGMGRYFWGSSPKPS